MQLDWLIIGGGIHGVHIAVRLLGEADVAPERLRIVDPADELLARWKTCTATTGMSHLRSPVVHHLDGAPMGLRRFARKRMRGEAGLFAPPYDQPALRLFNAHCDHVATSFGLPDLHIRDRATACHVDCDAVRVQLNDGTELETRHLVLAIGASEQPRWPAWAPRDHARVHHVFDPAFSGWPTARERVAVIGGGISATQVALRLADEGHEPVLISPHDIREHQFDSDPGWLGPKFMAGFDRERDHDRRRALINEARNVGSIPPDTERALRRALSRGEVTWREGEIVDCDTNRTDLLLHFSSGAVMAADRVLLGTGFESHRPGGSFIDDLAASASLPCATCGYPIVDEALRWHPRVHVTGPLAELELGPTSRNIAGARRAADRLVGALRSGAITP